MKRLPSWGMAGRRTASATVLLALVAVGPAGATATGADRKGPCDLADRLSDAGLLTAATERYRAIAAREAAASRAAKAGGSATRASPPRKAPLAVSCTKTGLKRIAGLRAHRAARIRKAAIRINRNATRLRARQDRRNRLTLVQTSVAPGTIARMEGAAKLGMADQIPHLVAYAIHRDDRGRHGLAIARVLRYANYPLVAARVATDTLAVHPSAHLPPRLLRLVAARRSLEARYEIAKARKFAEAGLDAAADDAVKAAINADPAVNVPDEVASPTREVPFWNRARGHFGPWLRTLAEMLIAALAIAVLALVLARIPRRFRMRVAVDAFTDGPDETTRCASAAAVRENYGRLLRDGGRRLKYVGSSGESFEAVSKQVAEIYKPAGVVASLLSLLDRLVPARTRRLSGQLRTIDPGRGAGLTVTFGRRYGKVFEETTLWESDYGRPATIASGKSVQPAYDRVALPAAAWVTYAAAATTLPRGVRRRLRRMFPPLLATSMRFVRLWLAGVAPALRRPYRWLRRRLSWVGRWSAPFEVLGTDDWRSYAHFVVGADLQARGALSDAQLAYERALGRDPRNRGAAFNLGVLEQQQGLERGRQRLKRLKRAIGDNKADELWFRVRYAQTIAWLDMGKFEKARSSAVRLCAAIVAERMSSSRRLLNLGHRRAQAAFLDTVEPSALLLLASALYDAEKSARPAPAGAAPVTPASLELPLTRTQLERELSSVTDDPDSVATFADAVAHAKLVELVAREGRLDPPALYNRACYDARTLQGALAEDPRWVKVEQRLLEAIRRDGPRLAEWAGHDPTLLEYRSDRERRQRLAQVCNELKSFGAT